MSSVVLRKGREVRADSWRDCVLSRRHIRCVRVGVFFAEPDVESSATLIVRSWICALHIACTLPGKECGSRAAAVVLVYDVQVVSQW